MADGYGSWLPSTIAISPRPLAMSCSEVPQSGTSVPVLHRGDVEIGGFDIRNRQQRKERQLGQVGGLEVAAARGADFDPAVLARVVGRGGDELLAALAAVDARVLIQLPRAGAERAPERPVTADHFGQRRPRAARGAVAVVPLVERGL